MNGCDRRSGDLGRAATEAVRWAAAAGLALAAGCAGPRAPAPAVAPAPPCVEVVRAEWQPMKGSPPAEPAPDAGRAAMRVRCAFAGTDIERASWDLPVKLDLSACRGLRFDVRCADGSAISHGTLYLHSGKGWYHVEFSPGTSNAWKTVTLDRDDAGDEGEPAGWAQIDTLRFSLWRGADRDTELLVGDFYPVGVPGGDTLVAIVRGDTGAQASPDDAKGVTEYADRVAELLRAAGVACTTIGDADATADRLRPFPLAVLPFNPRMSDAVADELVRYATNGGKLLAFYSIHEKLRPLLGLAGGEHVKAGASNRFAAIAIDAAALHGAPAAVAQQSWNITAYTPAEGTGRRLAEWLDDQGRPTGHAALIASACGITMSHVLLGDDPARKQRLLLAMAGELVPEIWRRTAAEGIARIGADLGPEGFDEHLARIGKLGRGDRRVRPAVAAARSARDAACKLLSAGRPADALDRAIDADRLLLEAHCIAQPPTAAKFRAFWCHDASGVAGMEWDEAARRLSEAGFNAVIPNMLWGGVAFYDSQVLPVADRVTEDGDQIAACLAACRKYGVQVHVWKVNWNLGRRAPKEFVERMRSEGRLQANSKGEEQTWLCPSHPENRQLEIDSMVEVARKYAVDGIHFDYIRYPDSDHCFCAHCRERFEKEAGVQVAEWPRDALPGGKLREPWLNWRRSNITAVVKAVSEQARAVRPGLKISAAVFRNWSSDRDGVGQDWKLWCDNGWLDFVCPMDYTPDNARFESMVAQQVGWAGRVPCYPGIGVSASRSRFGAARAIEQIRIADRYRTGGFVIFNYGQNEARELLPKLGLGITRGLR